MALSQSALSELLEAFRAGDGLDLIRESVRVALQELIEAEATEWQAGDRRYLSEGSVALLYPDSDNGAIAAIDSGE